MQTSITHVVTLNIEILAFPKNATSTSWQSLLRDYQRIWYSSLVIVTKVNYC